MATAFTLQNNVIEQAARRRIERLRAEGKFIEARQGVPMMQGEAVLAEEQAGDINSIFKGGFHGDQD